MENLEMLKEKYQCELVTEDAYLLINIISKAEIEDLVIDKIKEFNKMEEDKDATYRELRRRLAAEGLEENSENLDKLLNSDKDLKNRIAKLNDSVDLQMDIAKVVIKALLKKIVFLRKDINAFVAKVYKITPKEVETAKIEDFTGMLMGIFKCPSFKNVIDMVKLFFN